MPETKKGSSCFQQSDWWLPALQVAGSPDKAWRGLRNQPDGLSAFHYLSGKNDENYLKIISLGKDVIPLILDDWKETNLHWFHALTELTGAQPIKDENRGIIFEMKRDWINYFIKENRIDKLNKILDERNFSG